MKKRFLLIAATCLFLSPCVWADPEQARALGQLAEDLQHYSYAAQAEIEQNSYGDKIKPSEQLNSGLQQLGVYAYRVSREIAERGGPEDFQCIFQGMAEEVDTQLNALETAKDGETQLKAYQRISSMLSDASAVSEAAALTLEDLPKNRPQANPNIGTCDAVYE